MKEERRMKRITLLLLSLLLVFTLCACRSDREGNSENSNLPENSVPESSEEAEATITLNTPYIDLQIPASYEGKVEAEVTSEDPYTLTFKTTNGTEIYTLYFGKETENLFGTILMEDKNVVLYASFEAFDKEDEHYNEYGEYQDGVNTILHNLMKNDNFIVNEIVEYEDTTTFDIKTDLVTLKYPNKWKDKVTVEVTDDMVKFSCGQEKLFDLVFKECDGYLLGTYQDTPIYIISYEFDETKYDEAEQMELYGMAEDVNVILQYLMEDSKFEINY